MKSFSFRILLVVFLTLLSACSSTSTLAGGSWQLVELDGQKLPDHITITLMLDDKMVYGSGGCNTYSGSYVQRGTKLTIRGLTSTLMACETGSNFETAYFSALERVDTFEITNDQLILRDAQGARRLVFIPMPQSVMTLPHII